MQASANHQKLHPRLRSGVIDLLERCPRIEPLKSQVLRSGFSVETARQALQQKPHEFALAEIELSPALEVHAPRDVIDEVAGGRRNVRIDQNKTGYAWIRMSVQNGMICAGA